MEFSPLGCRPFVWNAAVVAILCCCFSFTIRAQDLKCPEAALIAPCACFVMEDPFNPEAWLLEVDCSNVTSSFELRGIFATADFPAVIEEFLILENSEIDQLLEGTFGNNAAKEIIIRDTQLSTIDAKFLNGGADNAVEKLDLSHNSIRDFPFGSLSSWLKLEFLNLSYNSLTSLIARIPSSTSLKRLFLGFNDITSIPTGVFDDLSSLEELVLGGNPLTTLQPGVVSTLPSLRFFSLSNSPSFETLEVGSLDFMSPDVTTVSLSNNSIRAFDTGVFGGITSDTWIWLGKNRFQTFTEDIFRPIVENYFNGSYGRLYIKENPFLCECDIAWLLADKELMLGVDGGCWWAGPTESFWNLDLADYADCDPQ